MERSLMIVSFALFFLCLCLDLGHSRVAAETIECKYESSGWSYATESKLYLCDLENINVFNTGERVHIDGVTGEHEAGKGNENVQGIVIYEAPNMGKFPAGLATIFPNLLGIQVYNSKLSEITSEDLREIGKLKYLWLNFNQLTHISGNLFVHNKHLEVLLIHSNKIVHVDRESFSGLSKLRHLDFDFNPCNPELATTRAGVEAFVKRIEAGVCESDAFTTTTLEQNQNRNLAAERVLQQHQLLTLAKEGGDE